MPMEKAALKPMAWSTVEIGGLRMSASTLQDAALDIVDRCGRRERGAGPVVMSSVNGQVLSLCASRPDIRDLFSSADVLHCDGQPLVLLSRLFGSVAFPERVATTDLYPAVAALAARRGATFYLLGAGAEANRRAVENSLAAHPGLEIVGSSHGYLSPREEERVVAEIAALRPDVLWVSLGVPREQLFCARHPTPLAGGGVIKTSGGLFDFLAGAKRRAPRIVQRAGLEWLFRMLQEPKRLSMRYVVTNPHATTIALASFWSQAAARRLGRRGRPEQRAGIP